MPTPTTEAVGAEPSPIPPTRRGPEPGLPCFPMPPRGAAPFASLQESRQMLRWASNHPTPPKRCHRARCLSHAPVSAVDAEAPPTETALSIGWSAPKRVPCNPTFTRRFAPVECRNTPCNSRLDGRNHQSASCTCCPTTEVAAPSTPRSRRSDHVVQTWPLQSTRRSTQTART